MPDRTLIMVDVDDGTEVEAEPIVVYRFSDGTAEIHLPPVLPADGVLSLDVVAAVRLSAALRGHVAHFREAA